jgi:GH43 family beta-xylosidase
MDEQMQGVRGAIHSRPAVRPDAQAVAHFTNPVISDGGSRDHGDPFVLRHLDRYYLFHTTDDGDSGISVHESADLVHWTFSGYALEPGPRGHWAETDLWAPEVLHRHGTFYMYVAGTRMGDDGEGVESLRRQGLARSSSPLGPYVLDPEPLVHDVWSIDGHPFEDEDGSLWLFYNVRTGGTRFRGKPGSGTVVDRLVAPDRLEGDPVPVAFPSEDWEGRADREAYWNEGSWVLKRRGQYHHLYSGGHYLDASYAIGLTSARHPRGPWRKDPDNPILRSGHRITGPGHHSVILGPDGVTAYAVYHAYDGVLEGRKVHLDPIEWCGDRPLIGPGPVTGRPTERAQPVPPPPVHDPGVPWWHADLWVDGTRVTVGDKAIELGHRTDVRRVRINQSARGLRAWVDGRLIAQHPGLHPPELDTDGAILDGSLTSHLSDETVYWLSPGERQEWAWGGSGPLEVTVAVRGAALLLAGGHEARAVSPVERFALVTLAVPDGAREICAIGEGAGAQVTDLFVAAR